MKRKKIYYNEEKNVDELKKKTPRGTCRHTGTSWYSFLSIQLLINPCNKRKV
jgi:hypothetical protein